MPHGSRRGHHRLRRGSHSQERLYGDLKGNEQGDVEASCCAHRHTTLGDRTILTEYRCMLQFVKPNLLGTRKEFQNRFANPIKSGQHSDSTPYDVKLMKKRAHILHDLLAGCVQRRDYSALTKFLPPKTEFVISVRLSEVQIALYSKYMRLNGHSNEELSTPLKNVGATLFQDYHHLMCIWSHPWMLKLKQIREEKRAMMTNWDDDSDGSIDDEDDTEAEDSPNSDHSDVIELDSDGSETKKQKNKRSNGGSAEELARRAIPTTIRFPVTSDKSTASATSLNEGNALHSCDADESLCRPSPTSASASCHPCVEMKTTFAQAIAQVCARPVGGHQRVSVFDIPGCQGLAFPI
ncbi:PREDICTED: transcriptional regulator ATRX homolog [Priapulus caudatus]|uniref:Transcriptional regulator ATRX homolog n=1 Tax=Priapulus caudatus TaxID=37621 RepID=A0ABM1F4B6_PRICU|nr:PREDICTED: transcriptional regulator ATRX homolog [Priapulus caudatus]